MRSMYACLKGSISQEKTWSTPSLDPYTDSVAAAILSSASRGDSVPEHIVATRSGRPSALMKSLSSGSFLTMSVNMPCTSRMAGRFSASWHLDCVSWVSTSAVLPELAFLLKVEVKGVGRVSGDGSGVEGTRERALEVGRQGRGWEISETDIARGVLKIARAI